MRPDVLILGQITVDDTVPSEPGPWVRRLGGNALYAAAGARLWVEAGRVGVVARVAAGLPFDVAGMLGRAGLSADGLVACAEEPLIEWILYEEDGNRQSLPRNAGLRDPAGDLATLYERYLAHIGGLSATAAEIPRAWLPAAAIHLAPQVRERHEISCAALIGQTGFLSVDPSPHYSRGMSPGELRAMLPGATAFLPSQAEIEHLGVADWEIVARALAASGFAEVMVKRGAAGCVLVHKGELVALPPARSAPFDLTGAGDAFSGAYAASRALGIAPAGAAARGAVAAAMVIECSGAQEALGLRAEEAGERLAEYVSGRLDG